MSVELITENQKRKRKFNPRKKLEILKEYKRKVQIVKERRLTFNKATDEKIKADKTNTLFCLTCMKQYIIFTPTHGSWLNIIESLFAKMTKTFLRGIRVNSKDELKQRILKWIEELNEAPVVFRWKWGLGKISL